MLGAKYSVFIIRGGRPGFYEDVLTAVKLMLKIV
jgi:hypothetical protein